ncbi:hypothetical protein D3C77_477380 [compost metagenome]
MRYIAAFPFAICTAYSGTKVVTAPKTMEATSIRTLHLNKCAFLINWPKDCIIVIPGSISVRFASSLGAIPALIPNAPVTMAMPSIVTAKIFMAPACQMPIASNGPITPGRVAHKEYSEIPWERSLSGSASMMPNCRAMEKKAVHTPCSILAIK